MAKGSFIGDVEEAVKGCKPRSWWDSLPTDVRSELLEIRKKFQGGAYPVARFTFAKILAQKCKERGLNWIGDRRIADWLLES